MLDEDRRRRMNESKASLQRSIAKADQSIQVGGSTMEELARQGEQLKRINDKLDVVSEHMQRSQRLIKGMSSWVMSFVTNRTTDTSHQDTIEARKRREKDRANDEKEVRLACEKEEDSTYFNKWTKKLMMPGLLWPAKEEEQVQLPQEHPSSNPRTGLDADVHQYIEDTNNQLDLLSAKLSVLQHMGLEINRELDLQNREIERLHSNVETGIVQVTNTTGKVRKLL